MDTPLQIAVCEDTPADAELLISHIEDSGIDGRWEVFSSGEALLDAFLPGKYDLIFLDIYLGGIKGVDVAADIRTIDRTVTLAFTTTSIEHALESYRLKAVSYLEKPVRRGDVQDVLTLALARRNTAAYVTLLIDGENRSIPIESILYFELQGHAVLVHTRAGILRTSQTVRLNRIEAVLPEHFFRCHHSYIVNLQYVKDVDRELALYIMHNNDRIHIRRRDLSKAVHAFEDNLFASARAER